MKQIKLTQGKFSIIDDEDFDKVSKYKWSFHTGYARTTINKKRVGMSRIILGDSSEKPWIDHINGDKLDNRRENLRFCTPSENHQNKRAYTRNKSGYKGVIVRKTIKGERISAGIKIGKKRIYLGDFKSTIDAAKAYNEAAKKYFGEFARLNKI